ncbi:putative reverse transcriptase domain protein [Escherichia coli 5-366-08_S4_C2]|nr:putative reverse transcriptase domain protein [Escherichia coli BCE019_MS-13]ENA26431.1 putative reverse transcriptase domain protein [Escherichia coli BCE007_MS-11]ENA73373.1 putative reverse transcriptase domain protein [Escherichia coli 2730450]ENB19543.1 putative reverse transcriptase domain protein [Escherichia coli BCE030_MS-09]KEL20063.1 putative reverse transcriptase domain protein [Escherichia coli 5-366-08_S4_C2]
MRTLKNFKGELYRKCMPGASNAAMRKITETIKKLNRPGNPGD